MNEAWIALWHHRHGEDVFLFDFEPDEDDVIKAIEDSGGEYEPDRGEYLDIRDAVPIRRKEDDTPSG